MKAISIPTDKEGLDFLINPDNGKWIITNNPERDKGKIKGKFQWKPLKGTRSVLLNVGGGCNLACKYCFVNNKKEENKMPLKVGKKAIQRVAEMKEENKRVVFHGSEPLMNYPLIKEIVKYGKSLDKDINYSLQTNGTLLDKERIGFLSDNNVYIGVSLDGLKHHQDKTRPFKKGGGTYDEIIKNLENLKKEQKNISLISVVTSHNVKELDKIVELGKNLEAGYLSFNPVVSKNNYLVPTQKDLTENLIKTSETYFSDILHKKKTPTLDHPKRYLFMLLKSKSTSSCLQCAAGPSNPLLGIDTDGTIYPCDYFWGKKNYSIGHINNMGFDEASKSPKNFRNNKEFNKLEECVSCDWKRICSGGCPGEKITTGKRKYCDTTKEMLTYFAKKIPQLKKRGVMNYIINH